MKRFLLLTLAVLPLAAQTTTYSRNGGALQTLGNLILPINMGGCGAVTISACLANLFPGGVPNPAQLITTTFSATPTFTASSTTATAFKITLTGDVTSSTFAGGSTGQEVTFLICQDGFGSHSFAFPAIAKGSFTIGATASKCNTQPFLWDGTNLWSKSSGVTNQ